MTVPPSPLLPIVSDKGIMSQIFQSWTQLVSRLFILTGSGSPEGVVSANVTRLYMDTAGTAGSILYIKRDAAISNDPKQGWILV